MLGATRLLFRQWRASEQKGPFELPPPPNPAAPPVDAQLILHGLEQSPWAVLAAQRGWPMHTEIMMGAVGRLDVSLPDGASFSVSGHAGAPPAENAHLTLRLATADPGAILRDRTTLAGLLGSMGHSLDPQHAQSWLPELPGPQGLSYLRGHLTLALPLHIGQLEAAREGLRDLATACSLAQHPPWAEVALRRSWPLRQIGTGLSLVATVDGREITARLRGQTAHPRSALRCPCPPGVPPMTLTHIDHGHGAPEAVPHLIANTVLHIRALDPQALGDHLQDDRLFQAILHVVHGYPGSSLTQERIELVTPGDIGRDLEAALVAVAGLARALEEHPWAG